MCEIFLILYGKVCVIDIVKLEKREGWRAQAGGRADRQTFYLAYTSVKNKKQKQSRIEKCRKGKKKVFFFKRIQK